MPGSRVINIPKANYPGGQNSIDVSLSGQETGLYHIRISNTEGEEVNATIQKL